MVQHSVVTQADHRNSQQAKAASKTNLGTVARGDKLAKHRPAIPGKDLKLTRGKLPVEEANRKRSANQRDVPKAEAKERAATMCGTTLHQTAEAKAKASKTNRGSVERDEVVRPEDGDGYWDVHAYGRVEAADEWAIPE